MEKLKGKIDLTLSYTEAQKTLARECHRSNLGVHLHDLLVQLEVVVLQVIDQVGLLFQQFSRAEATLRKTKGTAAVTSATLQRIRQWRHSVETNHFGNIRTMYETKHQRLQRAEQRNVDDG